MAKARLLDEINPGFSERSDRNRKNRAKGVTFERKVSVQLRELWPDAKRLFGQAREGNECPDVGGTPFWLELGRSAGSMQIHKKLEQAIHDSETSPNEQYRGRTPIAIVETGNIGEIVVAMRFADFMKLAAHMVACKEPASALGTAHGKSRTKARDADKVPPRPVRRR